jgi:membrane protease subunit HflK
MPWNDQRGGGRGPWGQGPQGGGGPNIQPPDLDEIVRQVQARLRRFMPGGGTPLTLILIVGGAILALWAFSGVYVVQATERGVVLRFGQYADTLSEGLHLRLPYPIETVERVPITQQQLDLGIAVRAERGGARPSGEETLMLTGDENIVDIDFVVQWRVKDPNQYLFEVQNIEGTIKAVAESAMREAVGQTKIASILTEGRRDVQINVRTLMQSILDNYKAGVEVVEVQLQKADPPKGGEVIDAFRDVQKASADAERARNEAEKYRNQKVPEARGLASQIVQQAEAFKSQTVAEAQGEGQRFLSILTQYQNARGVTRERMFLETMEKVLGPMNKMIIDSKSGAGGVQPYLALPPDLLRKSQPHPPGQ